MWQVSGKERSLQRQGVEMPSEICVFSGQIPERTETEAGLLYEAKQVTAHRPHCSLWQGWARYLLHV